jgi:hypothetical protein
MLPEDLIARLRERAADPKTRSDTFEALQETLQDMALPGPKPARISMSEATGDGGFGGLMQQVAGALFAGRGFNPQKLAEQVAEDVRTGKKSMDDVFGGAQPGVGMEIYEDEAPPDTPRDLPPPASQEDIAATESALGFSLPADLKQLYTGIANGGFGPSVGFLSLAEVAARYQEFRSEPQGPCDEMWPEHLLPIIPVDMGEACYDLETGKIICWDQEELVDEDSEDEAWDRSFKPWAGSLADWLETWLAKKPMSEQLAEQHERNLLEIVRNSLESLRDMTPEERSAMGLPDEGWEEQICRNHGVDPKKVL